LVIFSKCQDK